jgi:hypothetical protein
MARYASWFERPQCAAPVSVFLRALVLCAIPVAPWLLTMANVDAAARRFPHAIARSTCGPLDGPAFDLYLLDEASTSWPPKGRYVWLGFNLGPEELEGLTLDADADAASYCESAKCVAISGGRATFESFKGKKTLVGRVDLRFVDGTEVRQKLSAQWSSYRPVCG